MCELSSFLTHGGRWTVDCVGGLWLGCSAIRLGCGRHTIKVPVGLGLLALQAYYPPALERPTFRRFHESELQMLVCLFSSFILSFFRFWFWFWFLCWPFAHERWQNTRIVVHVRRSSNCMCIFCVLVVRPLHGS